VLTVLAMRTIRTTLIHQSLIRTHIYEYNVECILLASSAVLTAQGDGYQGTLHLILT